MKYWIWALTALILTGCISRSMSQPTQPQGAGSQPGQDKEGFVASQISPALENYGPAPELENEVWLNSDAPLRLTGLQGKVILLEMWTYG